MFRGRSFAALLSVLFLPVSCAYAQSSKYPDIMPVSQIRAGMKGYGLTVFHGTKIEKFDVTVVGVVKKGSLLVPGHDMVLVRMAGGPMTTRQANLIRGMSGSPVYINGKMIGAFSQGEPTTKEPLGGVTPIEDMLEAWDPKLPSSPQAALPGRLPNGLPDSRITADILPEPIVFGDRRIEKIVSNVPVKSGWRSHGTTLVLHPCTTFATFSTASKAAREKLAKALEPYNVELVQNGMTGQLLGEKVNFKGAPLVPGAAFSMMLVTGDISLGATGTVSYRKENRILGFGHPFLGIGPIEAPLCPAWVYDVYPLLAGSYKISSPGPVVGASMQDRNFSISGVLGKTPKSVPVVVTVKDLTTGRARTFHMQTITHPNLYASVVSSSVTSAIDEIRNIPGAAMAHITTTVDADEIGTVTRSNVVFDARAISTSATADLDDLLGIFTSNPFAPVPVKSASVKVEIESGRRTAQVERIFLKEGKFEPGTTAEIGIVVKPYKLPSTIKTVKIAIPQNTPTGRYVLQVRGGAVPAAISFGGLVLRPQSGDNQELAPPVSVRQMINRYNEREKNNEIVARLLLATTAVNAEGERLSNLPPSLDAVMRTAKSSGVRLERDEVRVVEPTDYVISGQQVLAINVQRKSSRETPTGTTSPGTVPTLPNQPASGGGNSFGRTPPSDDDEQSTRFGMTEAMKETAFTLGQDAKGKPAPKADDTKKSDTKKSDTKNGIKAQDKTTVSPAPEVKTAAPTQATPVATVPLETPVGRQPKIWRQLTRTDFALGTARGVSVATNGDLRLTRALSRFHSSGESFLWSLTPDGKGGLFAGTGTQGRIFQVAADGTAKEFARLPVVSIHSLLLDRTGTLWAATGPNGQVYRIDASGKATVAYKASEKYALSLAQDSRGNVFVGTGGSTTGTTASIYRITPDGTTSVYLKTSEEHILSLAVDKNDTLYAGTSNNGLIYRITADGKASILYDAVEASISGLAVNSKGIVYAATAPRGVLYRITPDGSVKTLYDKATAAFSSLRAAPDDTIYAAGGSALYAITPNDTVSPFENRNEVDILSLAVGTRGEVYAGTGSVAEIYVAQPTGTQQNGSYESVVHDAKVASQWGAVRWSASVPNGTSLRIETRTGNSADPDSTWSEWTAPRSETEGGRVLSPTARYIQYRVLLNSDSATVSPTLRDIAITYLPKNQPPKVTFQLPTGGERWARQQTIKWEASDPDKDTLSYQLYYSSDNGTTWQTLPGDSLKPVSPATPAASAGASATPATPKEVTVTTPKGADRTPTLEEVTAELDKQPNLPPAVRAAILEQAKEAFAPQGSAAQGGLPPVTAAVVQPLASPSTSSRETSRTFDTKILPDGRYLLKVVASDRQSNPTDPLTDEAVSEAFVVCNTPPTLSLLKAAMKTNADRSVTLLGTASQSLIAVTAVQYRVDNGEWMAAVASDGIFDSANEGFSFTTAALTPGTHTLEVKAFNAANLTTTEKITVDIK